MPLNPRKFALTRSRTQNVKEHSVLRRDVHPGDAYAGFPHQPSSGHDTCGSSGASEPWFRPLLVAATTAAAEEVRRGMAVVKRSRDLYGDFLESMVEMIVGRRSCSTSWRCTCRSTRPASAPSSSLTSRAGTSPRSNLCDPKTDLRNGKDWGEESLASYLRVDIVSSDCS
ncbi:hypothetical protein EJB05_05702 [Eragrostis curvula]|uniref:Uncharacterized protein n=1 Tax=Eragrostis curvula TaxID=38414 RepID=A0A5J9WDT8_9POAL|nr:hypothetical protein EJB05_05702 [Eragrostis curvula]